MTAGNRSAFAGYQSPTRSPNLKVVSGLWVVFAADLTSPWEIVPLDRLAEMCVGSSAPKQNDPEREIKRS